MSLLGEIKRRKVFQVAAVYAVVAWLIIQIIDVVSEPLSLPVWLDTVVIVLLAVGFPVAVILAWAFDLTPEGVVKDTGTVQSSGRRIEYALIGLLVVAVGFLFFDAYVPEYTPIPAADPADRRSIAVLPLENLSPDPDNAYFADGIHGELLTTLANIGSLKVISRTSVMEYRDSPKNMREIGQELNVATILEGDVRRAGDTVRINVQLIDANTDEHLWAEIYEREMTVENIFAIQSDIATRIAEALETALTPEEEAQINEVPTQNLRAHDFYLLAKEYIAATTLWRNRC
jgi:TolB-like protein